MKEKNLRSREITHVTRRRTDDNRVRAWKTATKREGGEDPRPEGGELDASWEGGFGRGNNQRTPR